MAPQILQNPSAIQRVSNFGVEGNSIAISVTQTSSPVQFPDLPSNSHSTDVMISNAGTKAAFIAFGRATLTAEIPTAGTPKNGTCVLPGTIMILSKGQNNWVAAVCGTGDTTTLYLSQGYGS